MVSNTIIKCLPFFFTALFSHELAPLGELPVLDIEFFALVDPAAKHLVDLPDAVDAITYDAYGGTNTLLQVKGGLGVFQDKKDSSNPHGFCHWFPTVTLTDQIHQLDFLAHLGFNPLPPARVHIEEIYRAAKLVNWSSNRRYLFLYTTNIPFEQNGTSPNRDTLGTCFPFGCDCPGPYYSWDIAAKALKDKQLSLVVITDVSVSREFFDYWLDVFDYLRMKYNVHSTMAIYTQQNQSRIGSAVDAFLEFLRRAYNKLYLALKPPRSPQPVLPSSIATQVTGPTGFIGHEQTKLLLLNPPEDMQPTKSRHKK